MFSIVKELINKIQGNDFVSFYDNNNPKELNSPKTIIRFSDYHNILDSFYINKTTSIQLLTVLESSPYLHISLFDSYDFEYYEDSLFNIGIIGTNKYNYEMLIESINKVNLNNLIWDNLINYLEYIKHQFKDEERFNNFKKIFLKYYS